MDKYVTWSSFVAAKPYLIKLTRSFVLLHKRRLHIHEVVCAGTKQTKMSVFVRWIWEKNQSPERHGLFSYDGFGRKTRTPAKTRGSGPGAEFPLFWHILGLREKNETRSKAIHYTYLYFLHRKYARCS